MSRATGYFAILGLLVILGAASSARGADDCAAGPAREAIAHSTFAHGYLHGYQAGFQAGDADFHVARARSARELREIDRPVGYRPEFGPRELFRNGFREGFLAGYQDSFVGRDFRAFKILADATAEGIAVPKYYDLGFADGYKAGHKSGGSDLDADLDFDPGKGVCPAEPASDGRLTEYTASYCAGYVNAYRVGYSDGYLVAPSDGADAPVLAAK